MKAEPTMSPSEEAEWERRAAESPRTPTLLEILPDLVAQSWEERGHGPRLIELAEASGRYSYGSIRVAVAALIADGVLAIDLDPWGERLYGTLRVVR